MKTITFQANRLLLLFLLTIIKVELYYMSLFQNNN